MVIAGRTEGSGPNPVLFFRVLRVALFRLRHGGCRETNGEDGCEKSSDHHGHRPYTRVSGARAAIGIADAPPFLASTAFEMLSGTGNGVSMSPITGISTRKCTK